MNIMGCRLRWLELVFAGLQKTGIPFLAYEQNYLPFAGHDDLGIYYYIPRLMQLFSWSAQQACGYFFTFLLMTALISGFIAFSLIFSSWILRVLFFVFCLPAAFIAWYIGDVYTAYYCGVIALVPWAVYCVSRQHFSRVDYGIVIANGLIAGFLHTIRAHAALGSLVALFFAITIHKSYGIKLKMILLGLLLGAWWLPQAFIAHSYARYQAVLPHYANAASDSYHPLWHTIYVGFGLLRILNNQDISFSDTCGADRGKSHGFTYGTPEYEDCMRQEVFALCKNRPLFVLFTLWAKIGILLFFLIACAHIGLVALAFCSRADWFYMSPLLISLGINALFPLMAVPYLSYSMGFIAASALSGAYCTAYSLTRRINHGS